MISWWCTALERPWTWEWIPYPGVWIATALPIFFYTRAVRRAGAVDRKKLGQFIGGMLVFWVASDWPLAPLGAGYLASAHMVQFLLYTLLVAPLLLLGTSEWLARSFTDRLRITKATAWMGRSFVTSAVVYNFLLLSTHAPGTVDLLRRSQIGSFTMDVLWLLAGFILWLPVISPLSDGKSDVMLGKILYLFVTTSVIAVVPASYLTFTTTPIYSIYELAPRIGTITAIADQQLAGIIMKLVTIPVILVTIASLWFRWSSKEAQLA